MVLNSFTPLASVCRKAISFASIQELGSSWPSRRSSKFQSRQIHVLFKNNTWNASLTVVRERASEAVHAEPQNKARSAAWFINRVTLSYRIRRNKSTGILPIILASREHRRKPSS